MKEAKKFKKQCIICPDDQKFKKRTGECKCKKKNAIKTEDGKCVTCSRKEVWKDGECKCVFKYFRNKKGKCKKCRKKTEHPDCEEVRPGFDEIEELVLE